MALNCIVDDSALVAGIKDGAKYNIKEWIAHGAVNVFVPLHALERLNALRQSASSVGGDALAALEWLDSVTEGSERKAAGRVQLQGPDDRYPTWTEVERYSLPDTPFSSQREHGYVEDLNHGLRYSVKLGGTPPECASSSHNSSALPSPEQKSRGHRKKSSSPSGIPPNVQPLINFVVWRSQHKDESLENPANYILVTNEPVTQKQAQKFGVRAKLLSQVSGIVARDISKRKSQGPVTPEAQATHVVDALEDDDFEIGPDHIPPKEGDEYDDEVLFKGSRNRPSSFEHQSAQTILDPDSFGRDSKATTLPAKVRSPKSEVVTPKAGGSRGGRGGFGPNRRGNNVPGSPRARTAGQGRGSGQASDAGNLDGSIKGAATPRTRQSPKIPTGPAATANKRGGFSPRSRAVQPVVNATMRAANLTSKPIDPDSYVRPHAGRGRGRGSQHRLWDPNGQ